MESETRREPVNISTDGGVMFGAVAIGLPGFSLLARVDANIDSQQTAGIQPDTAGTESVDEGS